MSSLQQRALSKKNSAIRTLQLSPHHNDETSISAWDKGFSKDWDKGWGKDGGPGGR